MTCQEHGHSQAAQGCAYRHIKVPPQVDERCGDFCGEHRQDIKVALAAGDGKPYRQRRRNVMSNHVIPALHQQIQQPP